MLNFSNHMLHVRLCVRQEVTPLHDVTDLLNGNDLSTGSFHETSVCVPNEALDHRKFCVMQVLGENTCQSIKAS